MESTTTFKADIADLKKGIQEAAAQIKLAKAEFNAAAAGMDEWSNSADGLSAKVNSLTTILDAQQSILTSLKDQYSLVCQEQGENSKAATDLQAKIFNQQTAISKTEQELGRYKDALKSGEIGMASLADEVELANSEFRNATAGMSDWSSTSEGLQAKLKQLNTVLDSQEKSLDTLESEYERVAEEQGRNSKEAVQLQTAINNQKAAITNTKAEISQYSDALNDVESGSKALEQELKSLDSEIDSIEKDIKLANAEFDNAVAGISDWEGSVVGLNAKLENLDTVLESEKGILENLNRQYELTVEAQGSASDAARDLEIRINEQEAAVKNVEAETAKYESKLDDLDNEYQSVTSSTDKLAQSIDKNLTPSFQDIINTVAGFKLVTKAIDSVKTAITGAFERVDTMESFSNVMTLMTGSAKEADAALADITETVTGTAYGLVSAARGVQNFVTSGVALGDATDMIGTYTDAVSTYAGGTNMALETVTNALSDMSSKGQAYTREINSIAQTGIPAWAIYAEAVDASIAEVKDAVSNGQVSATDFIGVLTGALDEGTQSFASVAGAAQTAGASWTGTFDNMKADVTKSVTDIVKSIDTSLVGNSLPSMREGLRMTSRSFASLLKDIGSFITGGIRVLAPALKTVSNNMDLLTSALKVGAGAFIAYKSAMMIQSTISAVKNAMAASNIVMTAATALNSANTASIGANMVAIHTRTAAKAAGMAVDAKGNIVTASGTAASILEAAAVKASAFALTAKTVAVQFLTGNLHIVTAAQHLWNAAMAANPIGAIVAVVAALVAGIVVLVKWLTRSSDAAKELSAKNKELAESAEQAADAVESSKQAHEDALTSIKAESGAATDLAQKIRELSAVENKSAQDKALLNTYVGMLNDSMEDLGLQYDIENDKLNMTTDSIQRKIDAYKDQSEVQAAQERYTDLLEEQIELETQLENVTVTQMGEVEKAYRQKEISSKEYKKAVKSLAETEDQLNASLASVKDELSQVDAGIKKSLESTSETATKLTERFHALSGSASDMTEAIHESSDAYKENLKAIKNETDASKKLADKVTELSKKENKSAQDKALLKSYVNMLNDSMEDLNLLYDEEADALNMSANAVMDKVEAYGTLDQAAASQDRLNTILTEQLAIEEDLNAIHDLRGDWQKAYEEGKVSTEEYNAAISDLIEKEGELEGKHGELGAAYDEVAVSIAEGMATATNSVAEATQAQKDSIDGLAEKYTELSDKVTNAFEEIELEAAISTDKLTKTLEKNTEISEGWGETSTALRIGRSMKTAGC